MSITRRVLSTGISTPSFEAHEVSVEEEVIDAALALSELNNAEAEAEEIERLQEVANQTAQTVDYIETQINYPEGNLGEATQNEVALAEQVANLATIGTGEDADTVMPSSESYVGRQISCEGLKDTIRGIIRAIINAIKKLWGRLKKFWRATMSRLSSLKKSAQDIKNRASKSTGQAREKKIKISGAVASWVSSDGNVHKEFGQLTSGLKDLNNRIEEAALWSTKVADAGEEIAGMIAEINPETAAKEEAAFSSKFSTKVKGMDKIFSGLTKSNDKRFADSKIEVESTKTLMGEKRIFLRRRKMDGDKTSTVRALSSLRAWLDASSDRVKEHGNTEISVISPSNVAEIAEEVITLCDQMAYYGEGKGLLNVEKAAVKVEKALDKLARANDADTAKGDDAASLRRLVSLGHAYNDWARNPTASLVNHTCTVARAVLTIGTKSLAQYSH